MMYLLDALLTPFNFNHDLFVIHLDPTPLTIYGTFFNRNSAPLLVLCMVRLITLAESSVPLWQQKSALTFPPQFLFFSAVCVCLICVVKFCKVKGWKVYILIFTLFVYFCIPMWNSVFVEGCHLHLWGCFFALVNVYFLKDFLGLM